MIENNDVMVYNGNTTIDDNATAAWYRMPCPYAFCSNKKSDIFHI